jgi:xanthine phosphoribosyltransferase
MAAIVPGYDGAVDLATTVVTRARIDGELIRVDDFINHRVEPELMRAVGKRFADTFAAGRPDAVLTAEASGIPPAMMCAAELGVPMIYAKKYLGTGDRYSYAREVVSPTKGLEYRVEVLRKTLTPGDRILIIDDFLSGGRTAEALGEITEEAGCEVIGFGFIIEKAYMEGRRRIEKRGWDIFSLVKVASISDGILQLVDDA